jgi:hypothetical protein
MADNMNPIFQQIIIQKVLRHLKKGRPENTASQYDIAKEFLKLKVTAKHLLLKVFWLSADLP